MKKKLLAVALLATIVLIAAAFWLGRAPSGPGQTSVTGTQQAPSTAKRPTAAASEAAPVPPVSSLQPGEGLSAGTIARAEDRVEELRQTRDQLGIKMQSIEARLADPAESANTAVLKEARQALETSLKKMEAEENALAEFLRNERQGASPGP